VIVLTSSGQRRRAMPVAAAVCAVLACAVAAAGCSSTSSSSTTTSSSSQASQTSATSKVTITFESYNYGTPDLGGQGMQQLINDFEKAHPNITIKPTGASAADIYSKVAAQAAAGNPPDVAEIGWSKEAAALTNLPVVPVQDLAPASQLTQLEHSLEPAALAAGQVNGKLTVMPFAMSTPTLFYNATLFQKAGLNPADPPTTWAQAQTDALAIKKATGAQGIALAADNAAGSDFLTQSLINSAGGQLVSSSGQVQLNSTAALNALSMLRGLASSGASPQVSDNDAVALFKAGKLGLYVTSTALLHSFEAAAKGAFTLKTAAMPGFGGSPAKPTYSGAGLFVFSKSAAARQADWQFLQFMTSEEGFTVLTEDIGYLPLRSDAIGSPQYLGTYLKSNSLLNPALAQFQNVTPYQQLSGPNSSEARKAIQDNCVTPVMLNGANPAVTCPKVGTQVNQLLSAG
jgi:multiple sugar transport system substrate-binding protein